MEWGGVGWDQKAGEKVKLEPRGAGGRWSEVQN